MWSSVIPDGISTVGLALNCSLNSNVGILEHISCTTCLVSNLKGSTFNLIDGMLTWMTSILRKGSSKRIVCNRYSVQVKPKLEC